MRAAKLREKEERARALEADLTEKRNEKTSLEAEIGKSRAELDQIQKATNAATAAATAAEEQKKQNLARRAQASDELLELNKMVAERSREYDELVRQLRLFPAEIAGFIREGNRSIIYYVCIGLPFAAILTIVTYRLFSSAVDLTQLWRQEPNVDIWTVFLTRLPFVVIAVVILEVCGSILSRLVFEIIRINRQRIEFSKLSIIAKDVTTASASVVKGVAAEKVFDKETALKMELLREHMKNYVGTEFEYRGSGIISAIKGVADRLLSKNEQQP